MTLRRILPSLPIVLAASMLGAPATALAQSEQELPSARAIPGLTAEDAFPRACVDCHVDYPEQNLDVRFSTLLAEWVREVPPELLAQAVSSAPAGANLAGRHPDVGEEVLSDIPRSCLACHRALDTSAPDFSGLIHLIHLDPRPENAFLGVFQGECTHCHKLDRASGRWAMPSAPEGGADGG